MNTLHVEHFQVLSAGELLSVNGGAANPGDILSGLIADVTKTANDALGDVMGTVNDLLANLGAGGLGLGSLGGLLGGSGSGLGLGGLL
jgi:hypothetical protein